MEGRNTERLHLLLGAAAILALLVMPIGLASAEGSPEATSSASLPKQVKKLKGRIATLEAAVAALQGKATPTIPTTLPPSGAAGGDLTGTYPNPTIGPNAVTGDDILNASLSGASELAPNSVGAGQIGPNAVGASELNEAAITSCASPAMVDGWAFVDASNTFSSTFTTVGVLPQFNCSGGTVEARRLGQGHYHLRFNGVSSTLAIGSADGADTFVAGVDNWVTTSPVNDGGQAFDVNVWDKDGGPEDVNFTILAF